VYVPDWSPVGWDEVERFRGFFVPWAAEVALFVDAMEGLEGNVEKVVNWITGGERLVPKTP
jgi:hypothetical protein